MSTVHRLLMSGKVANMNSCERYEIEHNYVQDFNGLSETQEFKKAVDNNINNAYAEARLHIRDNNAAIKNKSGDDMCLEISNNEAEIGLTQYIIKNIMFTSDIVLMEQDVYIGDINSSDSFYLMYNIAGVDITGVSVYS